MFVYHYRILDRYTKETVSLGVLSDPDQNFRPIRYVRERFGCRLEFTLPTVTVLGYGNNWSGLERSDNPFAIVSQAFEGERFKDRNKIRRIKLHVSSDLDPISYSPADFNKKDPFVKQIIDTGVRIL